MKFFFLFTQTDVQIVSQSTVLSLVLFCAVSKNGFSHRLPRFVEKMFKNSAWLLWLAAFVLADQNSPPGMLRDLSFLRMLNKHYTSHHVPRTHWAYGPQESLYRRAYEGISHRQAPHPQGSILKATESSSARPDYSVTSQEYWRPSSANTNFTGVSYHGYSRPYLGFTSAANGLSYQDSKPESQYGYQYRQIRPLSGSHAGIKKTPAYYIKGKLQLQSFPDESGKPTYSKIIAHQTPSSYKKTVYPKIHTPFVKHKYPTQKTVHPLYKRYYQSPYQRYAIPSSEMLRYNAKPQSDMYYKPSTTSPASTSSKHYTTERMDDTHLEGSVTSEDYSAYNDTDHRSTGSYYESYEVEKPISELEESSYDENTTRGYYGDRIYMSTQVPLVTSDKTLTKNKYFVVRRTSQDDDIETIFE